MRSISRLKPELEAVSRITEGDTEKITEDVRQYAEAQGLSEEEALKKGMEEMAETFVQKGAEVYLPG